jgi:hypothetical protein
VTDPREIYNAYLQKKAELAELQKYADAVATATSGSGMTPVKPLATMGAKGPLLCDQCGKPMILEGGKHNGVYADRAWETRPNDQWRSYISGGMVVDIECNGTLRIYHGYPNRPGHCCTLAELARSRRRDEYRPTEKANHWDAISKFLKAEFPALSAKEFSALLSDVLETMFGFDPGMGVNRPPK